MCEVRCHYSAGRREGGGRRKREEEEREKYFTAIQHGKVTGTKSGSEKSASVGGSTDDNLIGSFSERVGWRQHEGLQCVARRDRRGKEKEVEEKCQAFLCGSV